MKWQRPRRDISELAAPQDNFIGWVATTYFVNDVSSRKESLLRQSLELARDEPGNDQALYEIVDKAVSGHFYRTAVDAVRAFSPDATFHYFLAISQIFNMQCWPHLPEGFAIECSRRLFSMPPERSNVGWNDHFADMRSTALGEVGIYLYLTGNKESGLRTFEAADVAFDVDEVIATVSESIVEQDSERYEDAAALLDLISTKTIKAKLMATLSEYA